MNILTKLSQAFTKAIEEINLETAALPDGTVIEADSFEVGMAVFLPTEDGEAIPLPEGKYDLDTGNTITIDANGIIVTVEPTTAEEEEAPEAEAAAPEAEAEMATPTAKKIIESQTKETVFSKVEMEAVNVTLSEAKAEIETLKASIASLELEKSALQEKLDNEPAAQPLSRTTGKGKTQKVGLTKDKNGQLDFSRKAIRNQILNRIG